MSGPDFDQTENRDHGGPVEGEGEDSLARAAAAGPPITNDEDSSSFGSEPAEAHDTSAAVDEERAENPSWRDQDDPHPRLRSIYGQPLSQVRDVPDEDSSA